MLLVGMNAGRMYLQGPRNTQSLSLHDIMYHGHEDMNNAQVKLMYLLRPGSICTSDVD